MYSAFFKIFFLSLSISTLAYSRKAPNENNCQPCGCSYARFGAAYLMCGNITTSQFLSVIAKVRTSYKFTVYLSSNKIESLPSGLLAGMTVGGVFFELPNLTKLSPTVFNEQENSLDTVDFQAPQLTEIPNEMLHDLKRLFDLRVTHSSRITSLHRLNKSNPASITHVNYCCNGIKSVDADAFKELVNLMSLRMHKNKIVSLDHVFFPSKLSTLNVENNLMEKVPFEAFSSLEGSVYMSSNKVKTFSPDDVNFILDKEYLLTLNNNVDFDCSGCQFKKIAQKNVFGWPNQLFGECYKPSKLHGVPFKQLRISYYPNCSDTNTDHFKK